MKKIIIISLGLLCALNVWGQNKFAEQIQKELEELMNIEYKLDHMMLSVRDRYELDKRHGGLKTHLGAMYVTDKKPEYMEALNYGLFNCCLEMIGGYMLDIYRLKIKGEEGLLTPEDEKEFERKEIDIAKTLYTIKDVYNQYKKDQYINTPMEDQDHLNNKINDFFNNL